MTMGVDKHLAHRSRKLRRVGAIMVHARAHGQPARPSRPSARLASPGRRRQWLKGYLVAFGGKPVNGSYLSGHLEAFMLALKICICSPMARPAASSSCNVVWVFAALAGLTRTATRAAP